MPRIARVVAEGYPHHITQRGNYKQTVFESNDDFSQYLEWLKEYCKKYSLDIWAYCLMTNHVHFVCVPQKQDSLSRTFNILHMRYAQYINRRKQASGHLWQGRFYSTVLDEKHTYAAIRYVENNPVRSGLVAKAEQYKWSSARDHIDGISNNKLLTDFYLIEQISSWRRYLREKEDEVLINYIRKNAMTGRPSGDESFVKKLERKFERRLCALPHGRPKKGRK